MHFCLHLLNSLFELQIENNNKQKSNKSNGFIMETYFMATNKKINQEKMIGLWLCQFDGRIVTSSEITKSLRKSR